MKTNIAIKFLLWIQTVTLLLFGLNYWLGIRLDSSLAWLSLIIIIAVLFTGFKKIPGISRVNRFEVLLIGILLFIVVTNLITALWYPVTDWDAVTLFDFRALVIQNTGWIKDTLSRASILEYPLFTSLSHWLMYSVGFKTPMPLYPLLFGSFLLACYQLLRRNMDRTKALLAILFLASAPKLFDQSLVAYSNMPYSIYLILGAAYLFYWVREHNKMDMIVGILLSILSLWVRSFPFFVVNILAVLIVNSNTRKFGIGIALFIFACVIAYLWPINLPLLLIVLDFIKWGIVEYYSLYSILLLLLFWYHYRQKNSSAFWPILIIGYYLVLVFGIYYYGLNDPKFTALPDTLQRTFMFINLAISWYAIDQIHNSN
ncbi:MAG: hypothetical protein WC799_20950 [Desulfobacteraceae bacterium]|jgi:hypothetical protein